MSDMWRNKKKLQNFGGRTCMKTEEICGYCNNVFYRSRFWYCVIGLRWLRTEPASWFGTSGESFGSVTGGLERNVTWPPTAQTCNRPLLPC